LLCIEIPAALRHVQNAFHQYRVGHLRPVIMERPAPDERILPDRPQSGEGLRWFCRLCRMSHANNYLTEIS